MKKLFLCSIVSLSFLMCSRFTAIAQLNCDEIKKENEYLKNALKITTPEKTITSSKIDFNFLKCTGNAKEQTVELVLTLVNHDVNQDFQFAQCNAIDMEGNEYKSFNISIGSSGIRDKIYTDVPVKTIIKFKEILPSVKMFKHIAISYYYGEPGHTVEIENKDMPIAWK